MFSRLVTIILFLFTLGLSGLFQSKTGTAGVETNNPLNTITVNSTADVIADDGQCTLREAITAANSDTASGTQAGECLAGVRDDLILVPAGHYLLTLVGGNEEANLTGDLDITSNMIIRGAGVRDTVIDGNHTDRIFHARSARITIEDLVITNGYLSGAGSMAGGGIYTDNVEMTLRRVAVRNNQAGDSIGDSAVGLGGGIAAIWGLVFIEQSEITNNRAIGSTTSRDGDGGGIWLTWVRDSVIANSTISGNSVQGSGYGGGIYIYYERILLSQVTITDNQTGEAGKGGGIYQMHSTVKIQGSIIAENEAPLGPDCMDRVESHSGNVIGDNSDCTIAGNGDDQINVDPQLESLQDNEGIGTHTHAPLLTSPAIDNGKCHDSIFDQRGFARSVDMPGVPNGLSNCDAGAHENAVPAGTPTVTASPTPTNTPTATITPTPQPSYILVNTTMDVIADDGQCSLREAITAFNTDQPSGTTFGECTVPEASTIIKVPAGHYLLTLAGSGEDQNATGDLDMLEGMTLIGAGANQTIIDGNEIDRVLDPRQGLILEDLTITNGHAPPGEHGGGIRHFHDTYPAMHSTLILQRVAIRNNSASNGGGIYLEALGSFGSFRMEYSEISENHAENGGGLWISHTAYPVRTIMQTSTISGNRVAEGGQGAGFWNGITNYFTLYEMTITDNWVGDGTSGTGGGVYNEEDRRIFTRGGIIADNHAAMGADCYGNVLSSGGNLIGDISECAFVPGTWDQINIDARLAPLQFNDGFGTRTHAPLDDSPALDRGWCTSTMIDQRGYPRPTDILTVPNGVSACDVGAHEVLVLEGTPTNTPTSTVTPTPTMTPTPTATSLPQADIMVNSTADILNALDGYCTLREAIIAANEDYPSGTVGGECSAGNEADTIILPRGHFILTRIGENENRSRYGDLDILSDITLLGAGGYETIVDAQSIDRVIDIQAGIVALEGMMITGGYAPTGMENYMGGGILINNEFTHTTIADVVIRNNRAGDGRDATQKFPPAENGGNGGGIALIRGTLEVRNSRIEGNHAGKGGLPYMPEVPYWGGEGGDGGGIFLEVPAMIEDSKIIANFEGEPAGLSNYGEGGGLYALLDVTIRRSTFADNNHGISTFKATIENSTFVGNEIGLLIRNDIDTFSGTIENSTFVGNEIGLLLRNDIEATGITVAYNDIGVQTLKVLILGNSIIDQNETQCEGNVVSEGYNLLGADFDCNLYGETQGNQLDVEAQLASLANNGGRTDTLALLPNSPALDAGHCFNQTTDQRGFPRPSDLPHIVNADDGCDIGAYEEQAPIPTATVTPTITATATIPSSHQTLYLPLIRRATP